MILKVLILGGTNFLGPHLVQELQDHGHEVTLFNRGTKCEFLSPTVEILTGNRDGNLNALKDGWWDAIIDTSGDLPRIVEDSSKLLADSTNHYTYISTIGVYEDFHALNIDENDPIRSSSEKIEEINEKTYEVAKALSEKIIEKYFPNHLIIRPGLIVGPRDPTNRFSYWPLRTLQGGEILAPGSPMQKLQFIDVRDLAKWIVAMIENHKIGCYNATGPDSPIHFVDLLKICSQVCNKETVFHWIDEDFLIENDVQDWTEMPLWLSTKRDMPGFLRVSIKKAMEAGLTFRPISETIKAIIEWEQQKESNIPFAMDSKKEQDLLERWKSKRI